MTTAKDLFAGIGGFSQGAKAAGIEVLWAANHNPKAVQHHALNHPEIEHACQDLQQADWSQTPYSDILLASPCCQGHTNAKGKEQARHDVSRSTAWAVVSCAEYHREEVLVVENVQEFLEWELFPVWEDALKRLGYTLSVHIRDAADHGLPQNRVRMFLIATQSENPLVLNLPNMQHVSANSFIRWGNEFKWNLIDKPGRSKKTLARIKAGRKAHGRRFIAPYYSSGSGLTGRSIDRPVGTISTIDRWAVIDGEFMRMLQPPEIVDAMGFPKDTILPKNRRDAIHMLGNAVCPPVVTDILEEIKRAA